MPGPKFDRRLGGFVFSSTYFRLIPHTIRFDARKSPIKHEGKVTSPHWDEARAAAYADFRFEFPEKSLDGKSIVVAGGTGGLGAATAALLTREGAHLILGYRRDRQRAEK